MGLGIGRDHLGLAGNQSLRMRRLQTKAGKRFCLAWLYREPIPHILSLITETMLSTISVANRAPDPCLFACSQRPQIAPTSGQVLVQLKYLSTPDVSIAVSRSSPQL